MIAYNPPRQARVKDDKFRQFGNSLARMGLVKPDFRATGEENGNIVVDPKDLSFPPSKPFTLRRDIVEFVQDES